MKNGVFSSLGTLAFVSLIAAAAGGCATTELDRLRDANRTQTEQILILERQLDESKREAELLRQQRAQSDRALAEHQRTIAQLQQELDAATGRLRQLDDRLRAMPLAALDPETEHALATLAAQHPTLIQFDAGRGMLRFASDLTFDSGSDVVKPEARQSLAALAQILTSSAAQAYEVHIVGHTDAQPISAAAARGHPTNMHLSCHRAIAVRRELASLGVPAEKMLAAGWGEHRPAVPNAPNGNTPQNRRVEIYLTRPATTYGAATPITPPPARQAEVDVTK